MPYFGCRSSATGSPDSLGDRLRGPRPGPVVAGAVDRDRRAGEEVAGGRGEVGDQPGHLLGAAGAADRDRALEVVDDDLRILGQQRLGGELAGGEGAGLDPEARPLDRQRPHHVLDRGAGGAGVDHSRHAVVGREGDAEHLAAALRDEGLGRGGVGHQPGALDVELDHSAEAFRGDRLGRGEELAAGVVDEDVEPAVALEHAVEEAVDRLLVADVERLVLEGARKALRQPRGLGQRLLAAPAADHGGAEARQLQRRLAPEAAAGAGDDADLPVEQVRP